MKVEIEFSGTWLVDEETMDWLIDLIDSDDKDEVVKYLRAHPRILLEDMDYGPDVAIIVDNEEIVKSFG